MRKIFFLVLLVALLAVSAADAARVNLAHTNPVDYINKLNPTLPKEMGENFFPTPVVVPQYSDATSKLYILYIASDEATAMVRFTTDSNDFIRSIVTISSNDDQGINMAGQVAFVLATGLNLSGEELLKIFKQDHTKGDYKVLSSQNGIYINLSTQVDANNNLFGIFITGTDS